MTEPKYQEVSIDEITVSEKRRPAQKAAVKTLAKSIQAIGLQHPIGLTKEFCLIHGRHRLEACKLLDRSTIPAMIHDLDDLRSKIAEIDENFLHNRLTAIQEAQALKLRKEMYLKLYPETKAGATLKKGQNSPQRQNVATGDEQESFAADTASKTGKNKRTVERAVKLAEGISDRVAVQLDGTKIADNKTQLAELTLLSEANQLKVLAHIAEGKSKTVKDAAGKLKVGPDPLAKCSQEFAAAVKREAIKISKEQIKTLVGLPEKKRKQAELDMMGGKSAGHAINPHRPPVKTVSAAEKEAIQAREQIKIWADTIGRWLGKNPSIDELRAKYPGKQGDHVVKSATQFYESLGKWQKVIK